MRTYFEDLEFSILAPFAAKARESQGKQYPEIPSASRTCFQHDRDRIIHSKAFRRLKHKTQVFVATESDHYRSRLTHTLEVAQLSRHLARMMRLNEDLSEAIALAHDLGHTPFGHSGERELNSLMKDYGGFEHNKQSRRIIEELEQKYPLFPGLNLSLEVREGLTKHATPWDKPEERISFITLEAQVANLADEVAYNNHDLDDGLSSRLLEASHLEANVTLWKQAKATIKTQYAALEEHQLKHLINSYLISTQVEDVVRTTQAQLKELGIQSLTDVQKVKKPIVSFSPEMKELNLELRKYLFQNFYSHYTVYRMNKKGQMIVKALFDIFTQDSRLLPENHKAKIQANIPKERVVADYIAGMTDIYAQKEYETIFS